MPAEVTSHELASLLSGTEIPVLVDFWAPWCGPCKAMLPALIGLEKELEGRLKVVKVNIDQNPDVLSECRVQSIPTLVLWVPGKNEVARRVGAASLAQLREFVSGRIGEFKSPQG